jgi:hypothetical protein
MYLVSEADAAVICEIFEREGELSAAIELRRRFPGMRNKAQARTGTDDRRLETTGYSKGQGWVLATPTPPVQNGRRYVAAPPATQERGRRIGHVLRSVPFQWCRGEGRPATSSQHARRAESNKRLDLEFAAWDTPRQTDFEEHESFA